MSEHTEGDTPTPTNRWVFKSCGVDYLTLSKPRSIKDFHDVIRDVVKTYRSNREITTGHRGYRGWDLACYGNITWRGSDIKVNLPGAALQFVRHNLKQSSQDTCRWFLDRGFKATRIDLSLDTADKRFNPLKAWRYKQRDLVRCEASRWDWDADPKLKLKHALPPNGKGMTTYVGSPLSDRRLRIYDKVTELLHKGGEIATDDQGNELGHLTRIELQCRREAAQATIKAVNVDGPAVTPELIAYFITFLSPRDDRKRRRKRAAMWWEDIVGKERLCLDRLAAATEPEKSIQWVRKQVAPTLKLMKKHMPEQYEKFLTDDIPECQVRDLQDSKWEAAAKIKADKKTQLANMVEYERDERVIADLQKYLAESAKTVNEPVIETAASDDYLGEPEEEEDDLGVMYGIKKDGNWGVISVIDFKTGQEFDVA